MRLKFYAMEEGNDNTKRYLGIAWCFKWFAGYIINKYGKKLKDGEILYWTVL